MPRTLEEIEDEIRSLDAADRDRLLRDLIADWDGGADEDIEAAWLEEAQRRYQEFKSGTAKTVPAEDVIRNARARLKHER